VTAGLPARGEDFPYGEQSAGCRLLPSSSARGGSHGQLDVPTSDRTGDSRPHPPVTVQLVNEITELCWGASYPASQLLKNETDQLKARSP
jgi:hypothetical protein